MGEITIDFTSDWHIGHPESGKDYPAITDITDSLQSALDRKVDAFVVTGDFIDRGRYSSALTAASIIKPYTDKGLRVVGIVGNHDYINEKPDIFKTILGDAGVIMLEGQEYVIHSKTGDKQVSLLGVSGEIGPEYDNWWRNGRKDWDAYDKAHEVAQYHRDRLEQRLENAHSENVVVLSHRSIVPDTIGSGALKDGFVSAQTKGFAEIVDKYAERRQIVSVSGHDHDVYPWEGFPNGKTKAGVETHNVAAPMRRRRGLPMVKTLTF